MSIDISKMMNRAKSILLTPKAEWPVIEAEKAEHSKVLLTWLLPLSLIPAVAALIGYGVIGISMGPVKFVSLGMGFGQAVLLLISTIGGAYITAYIINALAEKYSSQKDLNQAFALVAYAYTPACLGGIFQIIPTLAIIGALIGLYSLYLLYIGLPVMMKTPSEKNTSYFVVSLLCIIGVYIVLSIVLGAIMGAIMMAGM